MKNIFKFFALAATGIAAIVACNKIQNDVPSVKGRTISLKVGSETKTIIKTSGAIWWLSSDSLSVFDNTATRFPFTFTGSSNTSAEATFVCSNYTGSTPIYAVHFDRNSIKNSSYDGTKIITGQVKATQNIVNKKSFCKDASFSIGKIVQNGDDYSVETMKNCFSLIKFQLNAADIDAISVKGLNNEILAGWVDVDCDKLAADQADFWTVNTTKGGSTVIELTVSGSGATNGHFAANTEYYIAVLPQTLSGLEITLTKSSGSYATRTINQSIVLNRSKIKPFNNPLDQGLTFSDDIVLDCTDATKFKRMVSGESEPQMLPTRTPANGPAYNFWLEGYENYIFTGYPYRWQTSYFCFKSAFKTNDYPDNDKIKLPNISGYSLSELRVTGVYAGSTSPNYKITDGTNTLTSASISKNSSTFPVVFDISAHPQSSTSPDRYLQVTGEGNIKFILTYSKVSN